MTRFFDAERQPTFTSAVANSAITRRARPFPAVLFFFALVGVMSRGAFEIVVGKTAAYGVQTGLLTLFLIAVLLLGRPTSTKRLGWSMLALFILVLVALLSAFVTLEISGSSSAVIYIAVMLFFAVLLVVFGSTEFHFTHTERMGPPIVIVVVASIAVALLQQFAGLTIFPGSDFGTFGTTARPSGLTGSFLHYPIAIAILGFVLLGIASVRRRWIYGFVGVAAFVAVLISYSRSGMVLVLVGVAVGVLLAHGVNARFRLLTAAVLGAIGFVIAVPTTDFIDRFLSIIDSDGAGNETRIRAWERVLALWSDSAILFGSHTGEFTNVTQNLSELDSAGVAESSVLQLMINFGLLGTVAFYALLFIAVAATPRVPQWFRAGMIAALVQGLFYQSVEVLPYMAALSLTPFIASQIVQAPRIIMPTGDSIARSPRTGAGSLTNIGTDRYSPRDRRPPR